MSEKICLCNCHINSSTENHLVAHCECQTRPAPSPLLWSHTMAIHSETGHTKVGFYLNNKFDAERSFWIDTPTPQDIADVVFIVQAVNAYAAHLKLIEELTGLVKQQIGSFEELGDTGLESDALWIKDAKGALARSRALLGGKQ